MTPEEQRIAIADWCGWKYLPSSQDGEFEPNYRWFNPNTKKFQELPDYLHDLNAMHEAETRLSNLQQDKYTIVLPRVVGNGPYWWAIAHAAAAERAEALLKTIGKWND